MGQRGSHAVLPWAAVYSNLKVPVILGVPASFLKTATWVTEVGTLGSHCLQGLKSCSIPAFLSQSHPLMPGCFPWSASASRQSGQALCTVLVYRSKGIFTNPQESFITFMKVNWLYLWKQKLVAFPAWRSSALPPLPHHNHRVNPLIPGQTTWDQVLTVIRPQSVSPARE